MLLNKYYILIASIFLVVQLIERVVKKSNEQYILNKFYIFLVEQQITSKAFIKLFAILKIDYFV